MGDSPWASNNNKVKHFRKKLTLTMTLCILHNSDFKVKMSLRKNLKLFAGVLRGKHTSRLAVISFQRICLPLNAVLFRNINGKPY